MSSINSTRATHPPALRSFREEAAAVKSQAPVWKRTGAVAQNEPEGQISPDKLPPWVAAAAQQVAGFARNPLQAPYNLGLYIGTHIREYIDGHGNIREDIAALLQHPAVLAAAATVAPRIIGALAANQLAFNAPPQIGQPPQA